MPLEINPQTKITILDPEFVRVINDVIHSARKPNDDGVIINFRDPTHSAEKGGFHPVELSISPSGDLLYLTDFAYFGLPPFVELGIDLDWNFEQDSFRQFDSIYDLECGRGLLNLYLSNFNAYYKSGCFEVEVTPI